MPFHSHLYTQLLYLQRFDHSTFWPFSAVCHTQKLDYCNLWPFSAVCYTQNFDHCIFWPFSHVCHAQNFNPCTFWLFSAVCHTQSFHHCTFWPFSAGMLKIFTTVLSGHFQVFVILKILQWEYLLSLKIITNKLLTMTIDTRRICLTGDKFINI